MWLTFVCFGVPGKCGSCLPPLERLRQLSNLQTLSLGGETRGGCETLQASQESLGQRSAMQALSLDGCEALQALPENVGQLSKPRTPSLGDCEAF